MVVVSKHALLRRRVAACALLGVALFCACSDLTEPLPPIQGTYSYVSSSLVPRLDRRGTITIVDFDRRTARFEGTFQFVDADGDNRTGTLIGAFIQRDRIWFRFLDERQLYHEGDFNPGLSSGEIFFLGLAYETTGATFSLFAR